MCFAFAVDIALAAVVAVVGDPVTPLGDGVVAAASEVVIASGSRELIVLMLLSQ